MRVLAGRRSVPIDGSVHPSFTRVAVTLRRLLQSYPGGAAASVYHRGRCVVDLWGGYRDDAGTPWSQETMAPSFSTTKGVASTLVHIMVDRGLIDYDARVADYWPEFAQAGKAGVTVRHVLAHQSGLYHIRQMIDRADRMLDWAHMIRVIEQTPPIHEPGTRTGYHGLTYGYLVGELLQRVTGRSFPDLVREEIATPLGLDGMFIGTPAHQLHRAARLVWSKRNLLEVMQSVAAYRHRNAGEMLESSAKRVQRWLDAVRIRLDLPSILDALAPRGISGIDFSADATLQAAIPAANGLFTARSLARMYACLAGGGVLDGVRLLSAATLARATEVQTPIKGRLVIPFDMRWRLGYHGVFTTRGIPRSAFGHFGFGGSGAWADPRRELAVGFIVNSGLGTPFGDTRTARISGAALAAADAERRRVRAPALEPVSGKDPTPVVGAVDAIGPRGTST
jgi:CubicO group peptidase (beta-lactamase class C family)